MTVITGVYMILFLHFRWWFMDKKLNHVATDCSPWLLLFFMGDRGFLHEFTCLQRWTEVRYFRLLETPTVPMVAYR
jgi:hypothetical protein